MNVFSLSKGKVKLIQIRICRSRKTNYFIISWINDVKNIKVKNKEALKGAIDLGIAIFFKIARDVREDGERNYKIFYRLNLTITQLKEQ